MSTSYEALNLALVYHNSAFGSVLTETPPPRPTPTEIVATATIFKEFLAPLEIT
jgi:hypothetical protein